MRLGESLADGEPRVVARRRSWARRLIDGTLDIAGDVFGRETFIERVADDALSPLAAAGDYVWIDPDEPAREGRLVAVWEVGPGSATLVRRMAVEDGRRVLRALNPGWPERPIDQDNETMIRGVVVFVGRGV